MRKQRRYHQNNRCLSSNRCVDSKLDVGILHQEQKNVCVNATQFQKNRCTQGTLFNHKMRL